MKLHGKSKHMVNNQERNRESENQLFSVLIKLLYFK